MEIKKFSIERKKYYGIIFGLILVGALMAVIALTMDVKTTKVVITNRYYYYDRLDYYVYLKPNDLFNNTTVLRNSKVYVNITKGIKVVYTFSVSNTNRTSVRGKYVVVATLKTREWNKTLILIPPHEYRNRYTISFPIELDDFKRIYNVINRELGFKAMNPKVLITIKTTIKSKDISDVNEHTLWFPLSSKVFSIHTTKSTERVRSLKKLVKVVDPSKCTTRLGLIVLVVILMFAAATFYAISTPVVVKKDPVMEFYERNKDFVVIGEPKLIDGNFVDVSSMDELLKVAEILNKPIIKDDKGYYILDNNVIYKYIFKNKR